MGKVNQEKARKIPLKHKEEDKYYFLAFKTISDLGGKGG